MGTCPASHSLEVVNQDLNPACLAVSIIALGTEGGMGAPSATWWQAPDSPLVLDFFELSLALCLKEHSPREDVTFGLSSLSWSCYSLSEPRA
jgi:hypothetical protein